MKKRAQTKIIVSIILTLIVFGVFIIAAEVGQQSEFGSGSVQVNKLQGDIDYSKQVKDYEGNVVNKTDTYIYKRTADSEIYQNPDGTQTVILGVKNKIDTINDTGKYIPWFEQNISLMPYGQNGYDYVTNDFLNISNYTFYVKSASNWGDGAKYCVNDSGTEYCLTYQAQDYSYRDVNGGQDYISSISNQQGIIQNNSIKYNSVFSGVDLTYTTYEDRLKELFTINSLPKTPASYLTSPVTLDFGGYLKYGSLEMWADGQKQTKSFVTNGSIDFKDPSGNVLFYLPQPIAYDSNGAQTNLQYEVKVQGNSIWFYTRTPYTWLQNATFPVYVDPTITLQTADTENLDDANIYQSFPTSLGNYNLMSFKINSSNQYIYSILFKFNISSIFEPGIFNINDANLYTYITDNGLDNSGEGYNVSIHNLYNNSWNENSITWNTFPSLGGYNSSYTEDKYFSGGIGEISGWLGWEINSTIQEMYNQNNETVSFYLLPHDSFGTLDVSNDGVTIASKEYTTASLRPYISITYTPYIDINSPSPSQIFTQDSGYTLFNITNNTAFDTCYAELDSNHNFTLSYSSPDWTLENSSMIDGSHTVKYWCNETSTGTWRSSDSVSFDVDSVNITTCRDLTVSNRVYMLRNNVSISNNVCFNVNANNISLNLNNYAAETITSTYEVVSFILPTGNLFTVYNGTLFSYADLFQSGVGGSENIYLYGYLLNLTTKDISNNIISIGGYGGEFNDSIFYIPGSSNIFSSINSGNYTFLNVTYSDSDSRTGVKVTRKWYFDYKVNSSSGNLDNALVAIYDKDGTLIASPSTNSTGQISQQILTEYINNGGTKTYSSPYTVNVSKTGYITNSTTYNLTTLNNVNTFVTLQLANVAPTTTLYSPANNSWSQNLANDYICNSSDTDGNLQNITLYAWQGATTLTNTKNVTGSTNSTTFSSFAVNDEGNWTWNCLVYDNSSASAWGVNRTIQIDTTNPVIDYSTGTESNNTNFSRTWVFVNTSWTESNFNNITFYLYNETNSLVTSSTSTSPTYSNNFTALPDGVYYYNVTIRDKSSRTSSTTTRLIRIDDTAPTVTILYPENDASYNNGTNFQINYSVIDNLLELSSCWYDNGTLNTTITCGQNITESNLSDATYTYIIYSNDTLNNLGSSSVTFTISSQAPAITLNYPEDSSFLNSGTNVNFNFTAIDSDGLDYCQLWTNTTGTWALNYTWISPVSNSMNSTSLNLNEGSYKYNVWCNDTVGNSQFSPLNYTFTIDETLPLTLDNSYSPATIYNETDVQIFGTISDIYLDTVWIQINLTGSYENITVTNNSGNDYTYSISNSSTSNHQNISWVWWANDSAGNENSSNLNYFTVTNRNPYNLTITNPSNDSYINTNYLIINFSANDLDYDTLNYSIYYSNNTTSYDFFSSTTDNYINLTGFNLTDSARNWFYVLVSDGYLTNQSNNYSFNIDTISPNLTLYNPEASPILQCSLSNILLNLSASDTNLDYCSYNVTYGELTSTVNTAFNCSNTYFNVSFDNSVQLLSVSAYDTAGNENLTTRYVYFNSGHSSCQATNPPGGGGGGGVNTQNPEEELGFCGDTICQDGKDGRAFRGEDFYNCPSDCAVKLTLENFNLDTVVLNCFDDAKKEECLWTTRPGLLAVFVVLVGIFIFAFFFSIKTEKNKIRIIRQIRKPKNRRRR